MANRQIGEAVRSVLRAVSAPAGGALSDAHLLERFTASRDEAAFETLLWRHGPMVLGTVRRVLRHPQDAEDAFQATFLVLARKAGAIGKRESVGSWLYKVAYRAALRARARAARLPRTGVPWPGPSGADPDAAWLADDLRPALDAELNRLPEKYRAPLVLHYLEGKTVGQAARELACPPGTVASRLARARELLRGRLARRGIALTAALLGTGLAGQAAAGPVPAALALAAAHGALLGAGPAAAAALARGVMQGMALARVKLAATVLLAVGLTGAGAGLVARQAPPPPRAQDQAQSLPAAADRPAAGGKETADDLKDLLPAGALARLGTIRLRHGAAVRAVAFSADGKVLASAGRDWAVCLWDTATGRELRRMGSGTGAVISMGLSADGKVIAAAAEAKAGNVVRLWDNAGKELHRLDAPGGTQAVALTPDGKVLATADKAGPVRLWDVNTGRQLHRLDGHPGGVLAVAFAPDGKSLLSGGADRALRLWDVASGKELRRFVGHANQITGVAFAPGGKLLASSAHDGTVRIWDLAAARELRQVGPLALPYCVAFSPDGKSVVAGSSDRNLRVWEVETGRELRRLTGPRGPVFCVAFSADGSRLAAGTGDFQVHLWDARGGRELLVPEGHRATVSSLAFSPDGKLLATGGHDWAVCLWDVAARKLLWRTEGHTAGVQAVAFAPDGRSVASGGWDGTAAIWDAATGRELRRCRQGSAVRSLAFSPDGKSLAAGGNDASIHVWDVTSGAAKQLAGQGGPVGAVAFSGDGATLVSAGDDRTVRLWSAATGEQLYSAPGAAKSHDEVAFSPDGRTAAVHADGVLRLLEVATGKERGRFELKTTLIALGFAADSRHLLYSPNSLEVRVYDLAAGRQVRQFPGHRNWTHRLATAPDGKLLASGSSDGTVLLWGMSAPAVPRPAARRLLPDRVRLAWEELAGDDAAAAYRALWGLAGSPEQALPLLRKGLAAPAGGPDDKRVAALIADLDHDEFAVREGAEAALAKLGAAAGPALRKALEGAPSAEVRTRVGRLLKGAGVALPSGEELRRLRALEVLEQINTPEARRLLEGAAREGGAGRVGREAKAALGRLAHRPAATP